MPGAIGGKEEGGGYSYTVKATVQQVQDFYAKEMPKLGWQSLTVGTGETGNLILIFQKGDKTGTIGVVAQGDVTFVLLLQ